MLISVNMRCYYNEVVHRDEFEIIPKNCPLSDGVCVRGVQWITDSGVEFMNLGKCYFYDYDSYMVSDNTLECNFDQ